MLFIVPNLSFFNFTPDKDILVSVQCKTRSKSDSNYNIWEQPSLLNKLASSSCAPHSYYILEGKCSLLKHTHHNIECKVKLGVPDFYFSTKYKFFIHCEAFEVGGIDFSPKQFSYLFEKEKKINTNCERQVQTKNNNHIFTLPQGQYPIIILSIELLFLEFIQIKIEFQCNLGPNGGRCQSRR